MSLSADEARTARIQKYKEERRKQLTARTATLFSTNVTDRRSKKAGSRTPLEDAAHNQKSSSELNLNTASTSVPIRTTRTSRLRAAAANNADCQPNRKSRRSSSELSLLEDDKTRTPKNSKLIDRDKQKLANRRQSHEKENLKNATTCFPEKDGAIKKLKHSNKNILEKDKLILVTSPKHRNDQNSSTKMDEKSKSKDVIEDAKEVFKDTKKSHQAGDIVSCNESSETEVEKFDEIYNDLQSEDIPNVEIKLAEDVSSNHVNVPIMLESTVVNANVEVEKGVVPKVIKNEVGLLGAVCVRKVERFSELLSNLCSPREADILFEDILVENGIEENEVDPGELNSLLQEAQIPADLPEKALLCKWCRYFCSLLQRPTQDKHTRAYRRKLLQIYNVAIPPELEQVGEETNILKDCNSEATKQKKKARNKSKQRKSTDNTSESSLKSPSESEKDKKEENISEPTANDANNTESKAEPTPNYVYPETNKSPTDNTKECNQPLEEDIESLISSNKIPVPGAIVENNSQSDSSETDMLSDPDTPILPIDKQTELRYLLQKQNNPAQFQQMSNLTQKQKNILKVQTMGIQKPGQQHRINEKNTKKIQKLGQIIVHKDKAAKKDEIEKVKEITAIRNIPLNEECTIETIPNKKPPDIYTLKSKWQMSESFTQVKKNLNELSKKATIENPKKTADGKYMNPVKRLETNPSISVRELFPGEEEMSLQCNIDFNNVKAVTPEGWEKCNTMIQYDNETKRLWTELQRPYGNQSSFLRHLILLEKYFRSGDLVLSHNASPHAANYSCSVQNRLRAYDNAPSETPKRDSVSLLDFRKKPSMNGKSLLKSNQTEDKDPKKFMPPPNLPKPKNKTDKKTKPLPPELIAINTPNSAGRKSLNNVLQNIQQLVKDVTASDPTVIAAAPLPPNKFDQPKEKKEMPALKYDPPKEKKEMPGLRLDQSKKDRSPKHDGKEKKKAETPKKNESKGWRPTLMPITPENLARIAREPLKTSVDGHSLPSLVQVLSSGVRYHITFEDYNKMALIRKERRKKRNEEKETKSRKSIDDNTVVTEILPSPMLGNGGTLVQNIVSDSEKNQNSSELQLTSNAATILKNVGLKNITIAPITPKTATVTSQTLSPAISSPSLLVTTPIKIPQFGPAVSITTETILAPNMPIMATNQMILPKIPKSLTVIPQTVVASQAVVMPIASTAPSQAVMSDRP